MGLNARKAASQVQLFSSHFNGGFPRRLRSNCSKVAHAVQKLPVDGGLLQHTASAILLQGLTLPGSLQGPPGGPPAGCSPECLPAAWKNWLLKTFQIAPALHCWYFGHLC